MVGWGDVHFGSRFENTVLQSQEGLLEGTGGSWSPWICSREAESESNAGIWLAFPLFITSGTPA